MIWVESDNKPNKIQKYNNKYDKKRIEEWKKVKQEKGEKKRDKDHEEVDITW